MLGVNSSSSAVMSSNGPTLLSPPTAGPLSAAGQAHCVNAVPQSPPAAPASIATSSPAMSAVPVLGETAKANTRAPSVADAAEKIENYPAFEKVILQIYGEAAIYRDRSNLIYTLVGALLQIDRFNNPKYVADLQGSAGQDSTNVTLLVGNDPDKRKTHIAQARHCALEDTKKYLEIRANIATHESQLSREKGQYTDIVNLARAHTEALVTRTNGKDSLIADAFISSRDQALAEAEVDNNPHNAIDAAIIFALYAALYHLEQTPPTWTDHNECQVLVEKRYATPSTLIKDKQAFRDQPILRYLPISTDDAHSLIAADADALNAIARARRLAVGGTEAVQRFAKMCDAAEAAAANATTRDLAGIAAAARAAAEKILDTPLITGAIADLYARQAYARPLATTVEAISSSSSSGTSSSSLSSTPAVATQPTAKVGV